MEEKELKNENNTTVTLDSLEISKREDEDATLAAQHNGDKEIQGVKSISLGKSLLGDNTLKKGISVSVRGRNAGNVLNLKNGGSVWKKKDEKGPENQREEIGKKIDEESFPDLLESTEKIKSELAKDKDKKKKGGKELKKQDDGSFRCGSEKGKGESVSGEKRRPFANNLEVSQNNESGLKKWSDQMNENETADLKENEHAADEKQDPENVGYLMPGFKGKHMIGFYCFLKKGSQNPPPLPPKVPFDDTSFFEIIEKQKNVMTKPVMVPVINANQQMTHLGQGNQMRQVMQTPPMSNVQSMNYVNNSNVGMGGGSNQNQMNQVNKINSFNQNDKVMRKQQDVGQNRFIQNPQIATLSRSNLNMFDENVSNINGNNSSSINNAPRSNSYQHRGGRNMGQNNMNYGMNNTNEMMKNNMLNNANNYIKGGSNAGNPNMGGNVRQRNFNRRNEKKDDKKVKIADIDADTNWRSPLNKRVGDEKTAEMSNNMWNGSVDNNANNMNYNNDNNSSSNNNNNISNNNNNMYNNNMYNNTNNNNNNTNNNNNAGNDRMKRGFRNRNTNPVGNMSSVGSASSFNRNNFNANRNFFNRNNANNNMMNRNNSHKNNNMNSGNNSFVNNNSMQMNAVRNNMYRGNANRNNASVVNNGNYANYNNMGNNKNMNRNYVKRNNVGNVQNFGNNDSGNNGGVLTNNLFNRLSGNMFQNNSVAPATVSHTSAHNRRVANIDQDISANMSSGAAVTDRGNDLNVEIGNN